MASFRAMATAESLAAGVVILTIIALLGWLILAVSGPAGEWIDRAPLLKLQLQDKLKMLRAPFEKVLEVTDNIQEAASIGEQATQTVVIEGPSWLEQIFLEAQTAIVNIMVIFVLVFFLLARGGWTYRRVAAAIDDDERRGMWTDVLDGVQKNLAHYLLTVGAINTALGMLTAIAMKTLGMPNALPWGGWPVC